VIDVPEFPKLAFAACPKCGEQTTGGGLCFECAAYRDRLVSARSLTEANIPAAYATAKLGAPWLAEKIGRERMARAATSLKARAVLFNGPSASGKTSLAVAMMRAWVDETAEPALFALATELATCKGRARYGAEPGELTNAKSASLLVLDELGPEDYRAPSSPVTEVVFFRHAHAKPTWITTWTTHSDRVERYGDGFARRVVEAARIFSLGAKE
jgi:DNA replication protein DnaC